MAEKRFAPAETFIQDGHQPPSRFDIAGLALTRRSRIESNDCTNHARNCITGRLRASWGEEVGQGAGKIECRERLGGLLKYNRRNAA